MGAKKTMKTALFTFTYLHGTDPSGISRLTRAEKFLDYYTGLKSRLGIDGIIISDNGGSFSDLRILQHQYAAHVFRNPLMERGQGWNYLPCWRQQYDVQHAID